MAAFTLTPAFGGGEVGAHDGGGGGDSLKGKGTTEKPGGGGGGGSGGASTASSSGGVRMAYWENQRKRRTMSAQLVFPVQPPEGTENIDQPDPSLCGESRISSVVASPSLLWSVFQLNASGMRSSNLRTCRSSGTVAEALPPPHDPRLRLRHNVRSSFCSLVARVCFCVLLCVVVVVVVVWRPLAPC